MPWCVLSEGSKWSGWVRPSGLTPCAPRYYYSTSRCTLVYSFVLSSLLQCVCVCSVPVLLCLLSLPCPCAVCVCPVALLRGCLVHPLYKCPVHCPYIPPYFPAPIQGCYMGGIKMPLYRSVHIFLYRGLCGIRYFIFANTEHIFVYVSAEI